MGQYIGLWEVHALAIKIDQNIPVRCSYLPDVLGILLWSLGATLLLFQEYTGGQLPGLYLKMPEGPAIPGPCVEMSRAMSTQQSLQGLMQLGLAAGCCSAGHILLSITPLWFAHIVV